MSKDKMCPGGPCKDADIYTEKKGMGGAGGCPVKFRKREGTVDDKRIVTGMHIQLDPCEEGPVHKGPQSNFD